jgi:hypothetical protein
MEPVFMVLGQSSATAAAMAIDAGTEVQRVDVAELQRRLKENPLADGSIFEILVDNNDSLRVKRRGAWKVGKKGGYGPDFLLHEPSEREIASVRFTPAIPRAGKYAGYIYFPKARGLSSTTLVIVNDGRRNNGVSIRESDIRVEGQTSGEWVPLGTYALEEGNSAFVQVSNKDADGAVIADAVVFVPARRGAGWWILSVGCWFWVCSFREVGPDLLIGCRVFPASHLRSETGANFPEVTGQSLLQVLNLKAYDLINTEVIPGVIAEIGCKLLVFAASGLQQFLKGGSFVFKFSHRPIDFPQHGPAADGIEGRGNS